MSKNSFRKLVIKHNGHDTIWQWRYGSSHIILVSPENKKTYVPTKDISMIPQSVTPGQVADYIYQTILGISKPEKKQVVEKIIPKTIDKQKVYVIFRQYVHEDFEGRSDIETTESLYEIWMDARKSKERLHELNAMASKMLHNDLESKRGWFIWDSVQNYIDIYKQEYKFIARETDMML